MPSGLSCQSQSDCLIVQPVRRLRQCTGDSAAHGSAKVLCLTLLPAACALPRQRPVALRPAGPWDAAAAPISDRGAVAPSIQVAHIHSNSQTRCFGRQEGAMAVERAAGAAPGFADLSDDLVLDIMRKLTLLER